MAAGKNSAAKSSAGRSAKSRAAQKNENDKVLWSTLIFALAVLILAFSLVKGESAWLSVHNFLLGMFGLSVFFIPVILFYTSLMISRDKSGDHIKGKIVQSCLLILIISGAMRIFSKLALPDSLTLTQRFTELYSSGKDLMGGGLISAVLGEVLLGIFGKTGASILIVVLMFTAVCFVFNKTIFDFLRLIKNLFVSAVEARDDYEEIPERPRRKRTDNGEFKAPPGAKKLKNSQKTADFDEDIPKGDFNIDIKIPDGKKSKKEAAKEKTMEEADIIARTIAANESTKAKAKAASEDIKQKAMSAKDDMTNASGELDDIIRKAALSGRSKKQEKETDEVNKIYGSVMRPVSENSNNVKEDIPFDEDEEEEIIPVSAPIRQAAAAKPAASENNERERSPKLMRMYSSAREKTVSKGSTLASTKISDEEALDMPEAMTAQDIQKEIMSEEKIVYEYHFPPIELLKESHNKDNAENAAAEMKNNAEILVNTLKSFGVTTRIVGIHRGPTVTRYELQPSAGVKISKITSLADDIALNLAAEGVRIEAPIPGKAAVGIEVPNKVKDTVTMRDIIGSEEFKKAKSKLTFAVGKNIDGEVILGDISKLPHIIIAGTTGSGKSVCTNGIIMSLLYNATPDEVRLVLIDPKVVEFKIYDGIPHLLIPVVTDPRKAAGALAWAVQEMLKRYKLFADRNVRDINGYNERAETDDEMETLPRIVIIIDELADLMMAAAGEVEDSICRLAQMARAAGMHLIIATQRPTVDVVTGLIKANIPSRIALKVASSIDSRTILNESGAEKLLGQGDMLYSPQTIAKPVRVQNCFTSDREVSAVVDYIKNGAGDVSYDENIINEIESNIPAAKGEKPADNGKTYEGTDEDLIDRAIECVVDNGQCSTTFIQRKLKLGYARAARIMDELEEMGVVGPPDGAKPRQVLMSRESFLQMKAGTSSPITYYDNTYSEQ